MNIVWFKRDLRIHDNEALNKALDNSSIIPLYILEPELWQQPDLSYRQYEFLTECLYELDLSLSKLGQSLIIKVGDALEILQNLNNTYNISAVYSHQETWNYWTYERDKKVKKWLKINNIPWHEPTQNGVVRCLKTRDGWAEQWQAHMTSKIIPKPREIKGPDLISDELPSPTELGLEYDGCYKRQKGGRSEGIKLLRSFLNDRGEKYTKEMSSPLTAFESCSRLSPHIAFGTLSVREIYQSAMKKSQQIYEMPDDLRGKWPSAVKSFTGRLRWHCHFMQKLEDEPEIEYNNMHKGYDILRQDTENQEFFDAWKTGNTGFPMIDACMRALIATGWINFRMRAMLMSFASYHLWLDWRLTAPYLASLFVDYEPGIHYSQVQMQSGTTGINSIRIYNPVKQGIDQDPEGIFIKQWLPELSEMPIEFIHTPWKMPEKMNDYPINIVDEKTARKAAADKLYTIRKDSNHKTTAAIVLNKHGSRKPRSQKKPAQKPTNINQITLPL